jgi:hypothetical protein
MKLPRSVDRPDRLPRVVLISDCWVRTHPLAVGLFIVTRFTELLGGLVSVRSRLGRGTCFSLTVPGDGTNSRG